MFNVVVTYRAPKFTSINRVFLKDEAINKAVKRKPDEIDYDPNKEERQMIFKFILRMLADKAIRNIRKLKIRNLSVKLTLTTEILP
jgi:hypothetical protein